MSAYYNELDREKAAWLRELIRRGLIAPGDVDERDIRDVVPTELAGYRQCHFFAGVGIWSYALRNAGWPDDRPVWTVSCPCQPFSAAGKGAGFADERHLWPAWFHLAGQCRPDVVFGEQVESDDGIAWLDLVWTDMEALGYAFGPVVLPAAGVGAPHGRHRIWFVAHPRGVRRESGEQFRPLRERDDSGRGGTGDDGVARGLGHALHAGPQGQPAPGARQGGTTRRPGPTCGLGHPDGEQQGSLGGLRGGPLPEPAGGGAACGVADAERPVGRADVRGGLHEPDRQGPEREQAERPPPGSGPDGIGQGGRPGPLNGFWRDADWLRCRDELWRAVEPGTFPLAHGSPARVVRLRGFGDGIVAPAATEVVRASLESLTEPLP